MTTYTLSKTYSQTIPDKVETLTPEQKDELLIRALFTLERIALASNPKRENPVTLAGALLMSQDWFGYSGFRKASRLGDLGDGTPFRLFFDQETVVKEYRVIGPSDTTDFSIKVANLTDSIVEEFYEESRVFKV